MNGLDFFNLQFTDKEQMQVAASLEMALRCLEGEKGFENAIKRLRRNFPQNLAHFEHLQGAFS
jgi:hypothetical protein